MNRVVAAGAIIGVCALLHTTNAAAEGPSLGINAGSLGAGANIGWAVSERINLRLGANQLNYDFKQTIDQIEYDNELALKNVSLLLDWHPFKGVFYVSTGVVNNRNALNLKATPNQSVQIGDTVYTPSQVGELTGKVAFKKYAPYLGIGFGKRPATKGFGANLDIGVMYQGEPEVSLNASGSFANDPTFRAELAKEQARAQEDISSYRYYPVVNLSLMYRF